MSEEYIAPRLGPEFFNMGDVVYYKGPEDDKYTEAEVHPDVKVPDPLAALGRESNADICIKLHERYEHAHVILYGNSYVWVNSDYVFYDKDSIIQMGQLEELFDRIHED